MKSNITIFLMVVCVAGCAQNRSISAYSDNYNPQYSGEISQLSMMKSISGNEVKGKVTQIKQQDRVLIIQSGQMVPDASMIVKSEGKF